MKFKIFLLFFIFSFALKAQPNFTFTQSRGCVPLTVTFSGIPNGCNASSLLYQYTSNTGVLSFQGQNMQEKTQEHD